MNSFVHKNNLLNKKRTCQSRLRLAASCLQAVSQQLRLHRRQRHLLDRLLVGHLQVGQLQMGHLQVGRLQVGHLQVGHLQVGHSQVGHLLGHLQVAPWRA